MPLPKSCCLTPFVIPGEPRGTLEYHTGSGKIKWYHTQPASVKRGDAALVLFYDVFGFSLAGFPSHQPRRADAQPNPKILADEFAEKLGVHVYVPDYLPNPPPIEPFLPITDLAPRPTPLKGLEKLKRDLRFVWTVLTNLRYFLPVLDFFAYPKAKRAIEELRARHAKLGVLGYCRGGAIAVRLLSEQSPSICCGMSCHPGPVDTKQWDTIDAPTKWHLAQEDDYMKDEQIATLAQLAEKKVGKVQITYEVHEGTTHGFASRPNDGFELSKAAYERVKTDVKAFFDKYMVDT